MCPAAFQGCKPVVSSVDKLLKHAPFLLSRLLQPEYGCCIQRGA
jgi:hypothetical protein